MTTHSSATQSIPKIIHQTWKDHHVPQRWKKAVASVKKFHPDWEYRLWTDEDIDQYVKNKHPDFYPIFKGFNRHIMRVDVIRYIIMHDIGGMYCDMDFEFIRPYDYSNMDALFTLERDMNYGDQLNSVANYFFASVPGHPIWKIVLDHLKEHPPVTKDYTDVVPATGPAFLTHRIFHVLPNYPQIKVTPKPVFSPLRLHGKQERKILLNGGITHGFHLGTGTWKERYSFIYLKNKAKRLFA